MTDREGGDILGTDRTVGLLDVPPKLARENTRAVLTNIETIIKPRGLSRGAFNHHFASEEEIVALIERRGEVYLRALERILGALGRASRDVVVAAFREVRLNERGI